MAIQEMNTAHFRLTVAFILIDSTNSF